MSYFDLDDILSEEAATLCTFKTAVQDLGHLETGRETQHLEAGAQVSLPLWLSKVLNLENVVSVELPVVYGKNFCSIMSADPRAVNLGPHAHWYEVGVKVARSLVDEKERERIVGILLLAFSRRYVDIFRHAQNWRGEDMTELSKLYSEMERKLFTDEYKACVEMEGWRDCPVALLKASDLARLDEPAVLAIGAAPMNRVEGREPTTKKIKH